MELDLYDLTDDYGYLYMYGFWVVRPSSSLAPMTPSAVFFVSGVHLVVWDMINLSVLVEVKVLFSFEGDLAFTNSVDHAVWVARDDGSISDGCAAETIGPAMLNFDGGRRSSWSLPVRRVVDVAVIKT